jgi:cytidine deaminase
VTDEQIQKLIETALAYRKRAYAPYSDYFVGAALLASDGTIFGGCNVENAAYHPTICAERTAVVKAVSEGHQNFEAIAVVTKDGGTPCGTCRQVLYEFAPQMRVIIADENGKVHYDLSLDALLPNCFTNASLKA